MKKYKLEVAKITTSGHIIDLEVEGDISKDQKNSLSCTIHNAYTTVFGEIRNYLCDNLKNAFDIVGYGGNHVWCSDKNGVRLAIIKIKDYSNKR